MAGNPTGTPSTAGKKIRRLGVGVAIVVALYSDGWFYVASKFETYAAEFIDRSGNRGAALQCDGLQSGGFPFHLGLTCETITISDPRSGNRLQAGALTALARIYNPGAAVIDLHGPAQLSLGDGSTISGDWKRLRSSLHANFDGLTELSLQGDLPTVTLNSPGLFAPLTFKVKEGEFHTRQNNGDLDLAAIGNDFEWQAPGGAALLPRLSASIDMTVIGKAALLEGKPLIGKAMKGELRALKIETPDGVYGQISGPFSIDEDGYLSGTFKTQLEKLDLWQERLDKIFPDAGDMISGVGALLKGLAKGGDKVTVTLKVHRGNISLSLLPLGKIPPI